MKGKRLRIVLPGFLVLLFLVVGMGSVIASDEYRGDDYSNDYPDYLYYIEGTGSYFLPASDGDIFFNRGTWYRQTEGSWYTSSSLDGPWSGIVRDSLPKDLTELPDDFRTTRKLGMIPSRYVLGEKDKTEYYWYRYYRGSYYDNYERRGYRRVWHPEGGFWFFVAPGLHDYWDDGHRRRRGGRY